MRDRLMRIKCRNDRWPAVDCNKHQILHTSATASARFLRTFFGTVGINLWWGWILVGAVWREWIKGMAGRGRGRG
ncbi:hypothetical protein BDZ91DRAFT_726799 [Kalaharituber pfeilii]|nr:hypothetical protein BDZ91DRAFT_726799 [Kalaharituber pfeilii]